MSEGRVAQLEAELEKLTGEVAARDAQLNAASERARQLGAYEQEARQARETIAELQADLDDAEGRAEAAVRDAKAARAAAGDAAAQSSSSSGEVAAARQIAAGIRTLLG